MLVEVNPSNPEHSNGFSCPVENYSALLWKSVRQLDQLFNKSRRKVDTCF